MSELADLARPFNQRLIHEKSTGKFSASYVKHSAVTEKLLAVIGPFSYELVEIIRDADSGQVCGVFMRLTATIDGRQVTVEEVGDVENPSNWNNDGARLKDASSDALKRASMRIGVGLHLWSGDDFFLHRVLSKDEADET